MSENFAFDGGASGTAWTTADHGMPQAQATYDLVDTNWDTYVQLSHANVDLTSDSSAPIFPLESSYGSTPMYPFHPQEWNSALPGNSPQLNGLQASAWQPQNPPQSTTVSFSALPTAPVSVFSPSAPPRSPPNSRISRPDMNGLTDTTPTKPLPKAASGQIPGSNRSSLVHAVPSKFLPKAASSRKRKASSDEEDSPSESNPKKAPAKKAHNAIEKRYRDKLMEKFVVLRDCIPGLRESARALEEANAFRSTAAAATAAKANKGTILSEATAYIKSLEQEKQDLENANLELQREVQRHRAMSMMSLPSQSPMPDTYVYPTTETLSPHGALMSNPPQGMMPVPEDMANLRRGEASQPHYANAYPTRRGASQAGRNVPRPIHAPNRAGAWGNYAMATMAGISYSEVVHGGDKGAGGPKAAASLPFPFNLTLCMARRVSLGTNGPHLSPFEVILILLIVYSILAFVLDSFPRRKTAKAPLLLSAPSLASPVELRQRAWLTAIQTVWVPRHGFLLELGALLLKTGKLCARRLIGWPGYAFLTATTQEQENARVKAWTIAIDAQLTGGDAEISKSRLILTLMASYTLPDTPAKLMLRALHIRVLFWDLANAVYGLSWLVGGLSAEWARKCWNEARIEHGIAVHMASRGMVDAEPLPEHLAILLEKECDDILVPSILQRAHNLAWERPTSENATTDACLDGVVEDFAIASPLDALAAWYSCHTLKQCLNKHLASEGEEVKGSIKSGLELATKTAPSTSQAHLRAVVAQALVLTGDDQAECIARAVEALPTSSAKLGSKTASLMNTIGEGPAAVDVQIALTLIKCLHLMQSTDPMAHRQAVHIVNRITLAAPTMTLLSFAAGFKTLNYCMQRSTLRAETSVGLEGLSASLRLWMGREPGRRSGANNKVRDLTITRCLNMSKALVGFADAEEFDSGYVSSSTKGKLEMEEIPI